MENDIDISYIKIDLGSLDSVKKASEEILHSVSHIDALICNGAIAQVPKQELTVDGFESQLGVNHYGHFLLQSLLFPLINTSKGRIVTVGSLGYDMGIKTIKFNDLNWDTGYTGNKAYSQSKLAQIMSVYELQNKLEQAGNTNVKVYACHPGASRTSLIANSGSPMMRFIFWLMTFLPLTQSAQAGAYSQLLCATEPNLDQSGFYGPIKGGHWVGPVGAHEIKTHAKDKNVAAKLWEVSVEATGAQWKI